MKNFPRNFFRRHIASCQAGLKKDFLSYESDERRKGWKRCQCPISVTGIFEGKFARKATRATSWEQARAIVEQWDSGSTEIPTTRQESEQISTSDTAGMTIKRALASFLNYHRNSAYNTRRQYGYFAKHFQAFSDQLGYIQLGRWTVADVSAMHNSWGVSPETATKKMATLNAFFNYAVRMEWIDKNPARLVRPPRNRSNTQEVERIPFSDEELKRMHAACERYIRDGQEWRYTWTGEDIRDFILISTYTGLRISDVATLHIDQFKRKNECHTRTTKTGSKVFCYLPDWVYDRMLRRGEKYGPYLFGTRNTQNLNTVTHYWRRKLKRLWKLCGPWTQPPTPHRFRHTFARKMLQKSNITFRDVAELLGNSEAIVRKHYAAWVPERQQRLMDEMKTAFENEPMYDQTPAKVVHIRAKGA